MAELESKIESLAEQNVSLERENKILREENALLKHGLFGRKTERLEHGQLAMFVPSMTFPSTSLEGSSSGSWGRNPTSTPLAARASPPKSASSPAMIRNTVVLPAPLTPSTPILTPGRNESEMPLRISRPPGKTLVSPCMT